MGKNEILEGKYKGNKIIKSLTSNYAAVKIPGGYIYVASSNCSNIQLLNQGTNGSMGSALVGGVVAGPTGAIIGAASNGSNQLIKINWVTGEYSIVEVSNDIYNAILVGMNTNTDKSSLEELSSKDAKSDQSNTLIAFVIVAIWFIAYLFSSI